MIRRLAALLLLGYLLGFAAFALTLPGPARATRTDAAVVLTGGKGRVERGLAVLERREARRLLVSGTDPRVTHGDLAAVYHAPPALVACCVDLDPEAVDTQTNAQETVAWLRRHRYRSVRLVTSDWHMPRARLELGRETGNGVRIVGDAVATEPDLGVLIGEYNKYLWRRLGGPLSL